MYYAGFALHGNSNSKGRPMRVNPQHIYRVRSYLSSTSLGEQGRLPPERELAQKLGLTRGCLRGALKVLAAEGVIWRQVGSGTYSGPRPVAYQHSNWSGMTDLTNPREVMAARLVLEPELASMAALRATGEDLAALEKCMAKLDAVRDAEEWLHWDRMLHRTIAQAAGNHLMLAMYETIQVYQQEQIWKALGRTLMVPERMQKLAVVHLGLTKALLRGDAPRAKRLARNHVLEVTDNIFRTRR
jgi:DNA-binding FadR family transcriptional regulator